MMPVNGKPLLECQVENLKENGITEIIMVVGYQKDVIKGYFQDGKRLNVSISYFEEAVPLGTAGALRHLADRLEEDFILVFGDLFFSVDFKRFLDFHKEKGAEITLFAHPNSHPYDSDLIEINSNGCVIGWNSKNGKREKNYRNLVNAGLYILSKKSLNRLEGLQTADMEKDFVQPAIGGGQVFAYQSPEYVKDIGTPERLQSVREDLVNNLPQKRNLREKQKAIFLDRDGTINRYIGFLRKPEEFELEENAAEAVKRINGSGYLAVVITNQPVIARGEVTEEELEDIHKKMETLLGKEGGYVDGIYFCPHHPDKGFEGEVEELKIPCRCRKPGTGLIERAAEDFHISLEDSWIIGDTGTDIQAGLNAGLHTALVMTGEEDKFSKYAACPEVTAADLLEAVEMILRREGEA